MTAMPLPRNALMHAIKDMPSAPRILVRLRELLESPNADLDDVAGLIRRDAALTAHIIRIANSVLYNAGAPFASLEEALARVGFNEVYRVTSFATLAQMADADLELYGISGVQLRENSLLAALVMEALATMAGVEPRSAYTAGLLRSTGKIALNRLTRSAVYGSTAPCRGPLAEWEAGVVGLNNCEAAGIILEEWRFPNPTIATICDHYAPAGGTIEAHLLNLAAGAAEHSGYGLTGESTYWSWSAESLAVAGVDGQELDAATLLAVERFRAVRAVLG